MATKLLNPYQRNSVAITLRTLKSALRYAIRDLTYQEHGILYRQKVTLTDQQYDQIKQIILEASGEIGQVANVFTLPVEVIDSRSTFQGQPGVLWSDLQDIRAEKLIGYGAVAPGLETVLDPSILRLIELLENLNQILSEKKQ